MLFPIDLFFDSFYVFVDVTVRRKSESPAKKVARFIGQ